MLHFVPVQNVLTLVILAAGSTARSSRRQYAHARDNTISTSWKMVDTYNATNIFDEFDFFTGAEPTHGMVNYQSKKDAMEKGLAKVEDDVIVLAVDDTTILPPGAERDSVRISSKKGYNNALVIARIQRMPVGCSVWPAYWAVGPKWPDDGEIDILEGVHDQEKNQYTLHTSEGCTLENNANARATGKILSKSCASGNGHNTGCAFQDHSSASYGRGFNDVGGGVYATEWGKSGVKIWHFPEGAIPTDIDAQNPDPSLWGPPAAFFSSKTCPVEKYFNELRITLNITLCGDWAEPTYSNAGCPGTCKQAVEKPENYKDAKWRIKSIVVYQPDENSAKDVKAKDVDAGAGGLSCGCS